MGNDFKKITILIVDTDASFIKEVKSMINESFRNILFLANKLEDAQDILRDQTIDVILLNPSISDTPSFKTIKMCLSIAGLIPVIIVAMRNNNIIADQAINLGVQDYLLKETLTKAILIQSIKFGIKRGEIFKNWRVAEEALKESKIKYLEAQKLTRFGAWTLDIISNEMIWSAPMSELMGHSQIDARYTLSDYIKNVYVSDKDKVIDYFKKASSGQEVSDFEHRILINGTEIKYVVLRTKMYPKAESAGFVLKGTIQDISDRKIKEKLYLEKSISQGKLNVQKKIMDELNFHIRTPMATLSNALYLLKAEDTGSQNLKILERSFDDLSLMITNLINYNLLQGDEITVVPKEVMLESLVQSLKKIIYLKTQSSAVDVIIETEGVLPEKIEIDSQLTNQIITSLTTVFTKNEAKHNLQITFGFDGALNIVFKYDHLLSLDNRSMDLETLEATLETFATKEDFDSAAFDWFFARFILAQLKGRLSLEEAKEGTTLKVALPVISFVSDEDKKQLKPDSTIKLLLVEDHFLNQLTTKRLLSSWSKNVHVDVAMNGQEAIDKYLIAKYDIILMDIHMPIMDGYEATVALRKISKVPIVGLSADSSKVEKKKCIALGMDAYLEKPYRPEQLYKVISNTLEWQETVSESLRAQ